MVQPYTGTLIGSTHRYALRVFYEDTDLSGVVYHANYLRWFERARSDMLRHLGIDQAAVQAAGEGFWTVAEANIRYLAPARLDNAVVIETRAERLLAATCHMRQRALLQAVDGTVQVLADAHLRIGFIGPDGRPRRQPQGWRDAFARFMEA